jgi:hypothetical protein
VIKPTVIIIVGYHCYQLQTIFYRISASQGLFRATMKLLGIICVGFDVTDQLLIRFSAFVRYWRNNWSTMRQYIDFIDFKKVYDSVRREVLYNILIQFGIPMKLVGLIKMCLN